MADQRISFFSEEHTSFPYFVVSGLATDNIISDELMLSDVKMMLHRHLLEQGFDAVVFYDPVRMIYFYDAKSHFICRNHFVPTKEELESALRSRNAAAPQSDPAPRVPRRPHGDAARRRKQTADTNRGPVWEMNMGERLYTNVAYSMLAQMLRSTDYRCALILPDLMAMQVDADASGAAQRYRLFSAPMENRARNKNIIVFLSEAPPHACVQDILLAQSQASDVHNFIAQKVVPRLQTDENKNFLRIPPPNASEIGNMINMMRLSSNLQVNVTNIREISRLLATYCSKNWVSMATLYNLVGKWKREHAGEQFDMGAAAQITGVKEYKSAWQQLDELVGLQTVKDHFNKWRQLNHFQSSDEDAQTGRFWVNAYEEKVRGHGLNIALVGKPGTGKSKVASMLGNLYQEFGFLPTSKVIEVSATAFQNAASLHGYVRQAMGGVLQIEEAYSLMNRYEGQDIIDALVADMGTYAGQFAVVFCGYPSHIKRLFEANDGLARRFPDNIIELPDYTWEELEQIFFSMASKDKEIDLSELQKPENKAILDNIFKGWVGEAGNGWGNAGEAEALLSKVKGNCAERMSHSSQLTETAAERKLLFTLQDLPEKMLTWSSSSEQNLESAYRELGDIKGLDNVKNAIYGIARRMQLNDGAIIEPGFYVFHGPPGTGKTMMAEKMGRIFQQLGIVKRRLPYVVTAGDLLKPPSSKRPGEVFNTCSNGLQDALDKSENGILFIDEAHQLPNSSEGETLLKELVPKMEDAEFRRKHCIIFAGYTTEMGKVFAVDPGLESRFPVGNRIKFQNYTAKELTDILESMAASANEKTDKKFLERTEIALAGYLSAPRTNFGNARYMRNEYLKNARAKRDARILREQLGITSVKEVLTQEQKHSLKDRHLLTEDDIPDEFVAYAPKGASRDDILTSKRKEEMLYDKEEVKAYIRQITEAYEKGGSYHGGLNYTVSGPTGCGKATVIRTIANVLAERGLLDSKEVFFYTKVDLEGEYVGATAGKTRNAITRAQGGTVVVVNPSGMLPDEGHGGRTFGPEAIGEFFNCMGSFGKNTSFVLVDLEAGMEAFIKAYPSSRSNFERHFVLEDLSVESMQRIFHQQSEKMIFADDIAPLMDDFVAGWTANRGGLNKNFLSWANGDEIEKLLNSLQNNWQMQNGQMGENRKKIPCPIITKAMFPQNLRRYMKPAAEEREEILKEMEKEIGLTRVKAAIKVIETKMRHTSPEKVMPGHYCFIGNPGVGKTRMAEKLGSVLRATKVLKQGFVITRTAREMMEQLKDFDKIIRMAKENVLFVDEAHQLASTGTGVAVIKRFLTVLEDIEVMKNICIVFAGYPMEMAEFFARDSGLKSRFDTEGSIIYFDDYTPKELEQLLIMFGQKASTDEHIGSERTYDLIAPQNEAFLVEARKGLEHVVSQKDPNYGNARYVRNLLHDTLANQMMRLDNQYGMNVPEEEWAVLLPEDLPEKYRSPLKQEDESSIGCISESMLNTEPASPILPGMIVQTINDIRQSVFLLELMDKNHRSIGYGTAFSVTENGYLLTCAHVVKDAKFVRARLYYPGMVGGERWFEDCEILKPIFSDVDMAVVKLKNVTGLVPLKLRPSNETLYAGEQIVIVGYPFGNELQINGDPHFTSSHFCGSISSIQAQGQSQEIVYVDCAAKQGNSGSPVISFADGKVIGILCGSKTKQLNEVTTEELNAASPIRFAWDRFVKRVYREFPNNGIPARRRILRPKKKKQ